MSFAFCSLACAEPIYACHGLTTGARMGRRRPPHRRSYRIQAVATARGLMPLRSGQARPFHLFFPVCRASAPTMPRRVYTIRGPNDGACPFGGRSTPVSGRAVRRPWLLPWARSRHEPLPGASEIGVDFSESYQPGLAKSRGRTGSQGAIGEQFPHNNHRMGRPPEAYAPLVTVSRHEG